MSLRHSIQFVIKHPLNQDQKFRALLRFVNWQVRSRLMGGTIVHPWINGSKFAVRTGEGGLTGNIYNGLDEFEDMAFLLHFLRREDLFVDIGANVGAFTLLACAAIGARGYAFEPVPASYRRLGQNIELNRLDDRVKCFNMALGSEAGTLKFIDSMGVKNRALVDGEQRDDTIDVEVCTLDLMLGAEAPRAIKIDVEGYETLVIQGATQVLGNPALNVVVMELNGAGFRFGFDEAKIAQAMVDKGFTAFSYNPWDRSIQQLSGKKNTQSSNTIFIRDRAFVEQRLKEGPAFTVHGKTI